MIEYGTRARTRSICDEPRRHRAAQEQHPRGLATLEAVYYYAVPLLPTAYFLLIPIGYSYRLQYCLLDAYGTAYIAWYSAPTAYILYV